MKSFSATTEERLQCNEPSPTGSMARCTRPKMHEGSCSWAQEWCNDEGPNGMRCQLRPGHTGEHHWHGRGSAKFQWENQQISRPLPPSLDADKLLKRSVANHPHHRGEKTEVRIGTKREGKELLWYLYDRNGNKLKGRGLTDADLVLCESDEPVELRPGAYDPMEAIRDHAKEEAAWFIQLEKTLEGDHAAKVATFTDKMGNVGYDVETDRGEKIKIDLAHIREMKAADPRYAIDLITAQIGEQLARLRVTGTARFDTSDDEFKKRRLMRRNKES